MSNVVDRDRDAMKKGISMILGKSKMPTRPIKEKCTHVSDGFIYNSDQTNAAFIELRCLNCGSHYRMTHTGTILPD